MKKLCYLLCLGTPICLAVCLFFWRECNVKKCKIPGPFLALEEVVIGNKIYSGKRVRIICYFEDGIEGPSIRSVPSNLSRYVNPLSKRIESRGCHMLIKMSDEAFGGMSRNYLHNFKEYGKKLVLAEGIVHESGYEEDGQVLHDTGFLQIDRIWIVSEILTEEPIDGNCQC